MYFGWLMASVFLANLPWNAIAASTGAIHLMQEEISKEGLTISEHNVLTSSCFHTDRETHMYFSTLADLFHILPW
jgi:hypothetical protein